MGQLSIPVISGNLARIDMGAPLVLVVGKLSPEKQLKEESKRIRRRCRHGLVAKVTQKMRASQSRRETHVARASQQCRETQ